MASVQGIETSNIGDQTASPCSNIKVLILQVHSISFPNEPLKLKIETYINLKPKVLESVQILIINRAVVASAQGSRPDSIAVFLILVVVCGGD